MRRLTGEQNKALSNFWNNLAVAWMGSGVVIPTFNQDVPEKKILFFLVGIALAVISLYISLALIRKAD